ncbi:MULTISPECIES: 4-carboxy-4-hydroxy-2-oxoadipate aldolase/oxaloacetate decarboxylase [unclassified Sphingomonas]|uniref:4-carboxy-4-hydroxy-2-oxoadipate aldolase/oxaloacetate decarboxylase n=1 Tax=unclassified Sphingomonas TaxID=196159 RepID=UPI0006F9BFD2|nr:MULTISPECIES: 4-carboxy-4-hydroxy-2-oxoadipate aldolase/oxaloacetate decarboxylase [unclassified Sphingomonas]KQX25117.1 4-hydroxy-4-methyl-2-oxoglutarate aldolase [Sphingomonas sp. Root1294]KQY66134.1 4-hydroxy-4-methyl-2-oxoglutarate aldolase [Sphingomonas sp. Root50]KRB89700.1 4-hydroxy-4-methyl-2-oxoglutarate aldolase [Sphingomonas sp. Root720]
MNDIPPFDPGLLELAGRLGAATLHEAAGRIGALPSAIKPVDPAMRLAGPAFTVVVPAFDNLWIHRAIYQARPGDILVVGTSDGVEAGYWGDVMNAAAEQRGLGGLVIDGGVRDTAGLAEAGFPIFSNGVCIRGTIKGFDVPSRLQQPLAIGNVVIHPGDLVVGDRDGVVVLPAAQAAEAVQAGLRREEDEAAKIARIRSGERTLDIYGFGEDAR